MRSLTLCTLAAVAALCPTPAPLVAQDMAVAYIVQTITLRGGTVRNDPRHRPQRLAPASDVTAITRIEVPAGAAVSLSQGQLEDVAFSIADTAELPQVKTVQIDFDATIDQRCFYRALIHRLRELLPAETRITMTALAPWCMDDDWISDLPVDEAIPMLRMGGEWKAAVKRAREERRPSEGPCRNALQVAAPK